MLSLILERSSAKELGRKREKFQPSFYCVLVCSISSGDFITNMCVVMQLDERRMKSQVRSCTRKPSINWMG